MNSINIYITKLLFEHDCLIIPGFGAMLSKYVKSGYDPKGLFTPPVKTIIFNSSINNNDGLLANYIARKEKISYSQALIRVEHFVAELQTKLNGYKEVSIDGVGKWILNGEGKVLFAPEPDNNYDKDSFGLGPIKLNKLAKQEKYTTSDILKVKIHHVSIAASILLFVSALVPFSQTIMQQHTANIWSFFSDIDHKKEALYVLRAELPDLDEMNYNNDSSEDFGDITEENKVNNACDEEMSEPVISEPEVVSNVSFAYHIIAGCFKNKKYAIRLVAKLQKKGFKDACIVDKSTSGLYRVAIQGSASEDEAVFTKMRIKETYDQSLWVLKKE